MIGPREFPRCVIIDTRSPDPLRFWSGKGWVEEIRKAMLFADEHALGRELEAIARMR